jgi:hypothetical protein
VLAQSVGFGHALAEHKPRPGFKTRETRPALLAPGLG